MSHLKSAFDHKFCPLCLSVIVNKTYNLMSNIEDQKAQINKDNPGAVATAFNALMPLAPYNQFSGQAIETIIFRFTEEEATKFSTDLCNYVDLLAQFCAINYVAVKDDNESDNSEEDELSIFNSSMGLSDMPEELKVMFADLQSKYPGVKLDVGKQTEMRNMPAGIHDILENIFGAPKCSEGNVDVEEIIARVQHLRAMITGSVDDKTMEDVRSRLASN
jgi:hypothetical protein